MEPDSTAASVSADVRVSPLKIIVEHRDDDVVDEILTEESASTTAAAVIEADGRSRSISVDSPSSPPRSASDSGYDSDRRKSFSSSSIADAEIAVESAGGRPSSAPINVEEADPASPHPDEEVTTEGAAAAKAEIVSAPHPPLLPVKPIVPINPLHPLVSPPLLAPLTPGQHLRPLMSQPAMHLKQVEAALEWEKYWKNLGAQSQSPARFPIGARPALLPPVVLPLPVCRKSSPVGPKEARKYAIPKYAVGFVIGLNGTRIQATRDVSGATVLLLGDKDAHHAVIGVFGTQGQIHDAVYLMKQNILRHSGMFIGDINGMIQQIND